MKNSSLEKFFFSGFFFFFEEFFIGFFSAESLERGVKYSGVWYLTPLSNGSPKKGKKKN